MRRKARSRIFSLQTAPKVIRAPIGALIAPYAMFYRCWLLHLQERIFLSLLPNRRLRTMARNDERLVGQGEDASMQ